MRNWIIKKLNTKHKREEKPMNFRLKSLIKKRKILKDSARKNVKSNAEINANL
jgi:hypothetical protein